ncbi:hypothetical protein [Halalkalibacter oceani]|uniref:hypothetical protein n=1 Tax=Halalkalibacter oceani TaxID=1653776 RepID=UPI003398223D
MLTIKDNKNQRLIMSSENETLKITQTFYKTQESNSVVLTDDQLHEMYECLFAYKNPNWEERLHWENPFTPTHEKVYNIDESIMFRIHGLNVIDIIQTKCGSENEEVIKINEELFLKLYHSTI